MNQALPGDSRASTLASPTVDEAGPPCASPQEKLTLLLVDPDPSDRDTLERLLGEEYELHATLDPRSGMEALRSGRYACLLVDSAMTAPGELEDMGRLLDEGTAGLVVLTQKEDPGLADTAFRRGAHDCVAKSRLTPELLKRVIGNARSKAQLRHKIEQQSEEFRRFELISAHDLRGPLRRICAYADMLAAGEEGPAVPDAPETLARIRQATDDLEAQIDGLLRYARMGKLEAPPAPVPLGCIFHRARSALKPLIEAKGASVEADALPTLPGDSESLTVLLQALLDNALKFHHGTPHVRVSAQREGENWVLSVSDDGIGIDPAQQERIFRPFERLQGRSKNGGLGLGLATCRRIAEAHGGRIELDSRPGVGSVFRVVLPAEGAAVATSAPF